eukprot:TRINITY_DN561_c0_g1_i1.p1 TRINITY_DN561_c0_g1~~TRINITY_DN561_c0_g1_i1.p1  ORF type:complete len:323 (+),score=40.66 TRINITY_DN561_c0_g1_i1:82-969(+)
MKNFLTDPAIKDLGEKYPRILEEVLMLAESTGFLQELNPFVRNFRDIPVMNQDIFEKLDKIAKKYGKPLVNTILLPSGSTNPAPDKAGKPFQLYNEVALAKKYRQLFLQPPRDKDAKKEVPEPLRKTHYTVKKIRNQLAPKDIYPIQFTSHFWLVPTANSKYQDFLARKVILRVYLPALKLPPHVEQRLVELVGPERYNKHNGYLKLVGDTQGNKHENRKLVKQQFSALLDEAFKADSRYISTATPIKARLGLSADAIEVPEKFLLFRVGLPYLQAPGWPPKNAIDVEKLLATSS